MALVKVILVFSVIFVHLFVHIKADYKAAVVEYQAIIGSPPNTTVEQNLQQYVSYIESAKYQEVQIIVFPEYGLTGIISDPSTYAIEIPSVKNATGVIHYWLAQLSNAARANELYIVVNLLEKSANKANKTIYYNTNVVFDKNGKIVAKYRKINLFNEPELTPGAPEDNQNTFTTDFGVTFGVLTGLDIISNKPVLSDNVTDVVYPTALESYLPYLHSLATQQGYAAARKVNLLASSLDLPAVGIGGSGIWGADGTVFSYYIDGTPGAKMLVSNVKNTPVISSNQPNLPRLGGFDSLDDKGSNLDKYNASSYFEINKYTFKTINITKKIVHEVVCHKKFCCKFSINVSYVPVKSPEIYRIIAYEGPFKIVPGKQNYRVCSLVGCGNLNVNSCAQRNITLIAKFSSISVNTNITTGSPRNYRPLSLTTYLKPVFNSTFNYVITNGSRGVSHSNHLEHSNVMVFGILDPNSKGSISTIYGVPFLTFILIVGRLLA